MSETFSFEEALPAVQESAGGGDTFSFEEAMQPTAKAAPVEKSDWESAKESLGKFSFDEYLQQNASVNAGLYARKKITGDRTEGTLTFPNQELGFMDTIKETGKFFAEKPITAFVELAKGVIYNPELIGLGAFQSAAHAARLAEVAKLGATARAIAVTGASAIEGGAVMGGMSLAQQLGQKETVNMGEVGAAAAIGAVTVPLLKGVVEGYKGAGRWAEGRGKVEPKVEDEPMPDRFRDWVEPNGEVRSPGEAPYRQPNVFQGLPGDVELNAASKAQDMMQAGVGKKAADAATAKNAPLASAMEAIRAKRADAKESFGRGVQQGEWLGPEEPQPLRQVTGEAAAELEKVAEQRNTQRRIESGEADPRLLAALGLTAGAAAVAGLYPEEAKKVAGGLALGGALLTTAGKIPDFGPVRTLGGELARGKYTLKTLERLPQNRTEIPKRLIEQEMRRADVPKAEKDVLTEVLAGKGEQVSAGELVRDFRLATGDHTLDAKGTGEYADYGLERIGRQSAPQYEPVATGDVPATTTLYRLPEHMELSDANHFNDPKLFGWTRSFEEGGVKHVVEIQSDLAQHAKELSPEKLAVLTDAAVSLERQRSAIRELQKVYFKPTAMEKTLRELDSANPDASLQIATNVKSNLSSLSPELSRYKAGEDPELYLKDVIKYAKNFDTPDGRVAARALRIGFERFNTKLSQVFAENRAALEGAAVGPQVGPMLKHWPRRLIREELAKTAQKGGDVVRFADADTVAKVEGWSTNEARLERLHDDLRATKSTIESIDRYWSKEDQPKRLEELNKTLDQINKDIAEFKPGFTDPGPQSIYNRYKSDIETYLKGLGGKHIEDAQGHGWWEVPTAQHTGRIAQYGKADPKLLATIGLVGAGIAAGSLLAGDSKVAGAVLGGIAGAGLMRLPGTLAGLGKTLSWKQATWNAARVGAVLGAGTYIGGKDGDPVYGAAVAASIILGKAALKPAVKLGTDAFINIRNGNIAAETRIIDNMIRDINKAIPEAERRIEVSRALDSGSMEGLNTNERVVYRYVRNFLDKIGAEAKDEGVIRGMRSNYISYIVERDPTMSLERESGIIEKLFETGSGRTEGSPNTRFGKRGKYETFDEINRALLGSGLRLKTQDVGEIVGIYAKSMRTAIENKILLDKVKEAKSPEGVPYLVRQDKNGNLPQGYEKFNHPQMQGYGVHPDLKDSLGVVLNNSDPNVVTRGMLGLSMAIKRVQVYGSLFHAKSLMEVYLNAMGKDAFSVKTGISLKPIDAALKAFREGGLGDTLDLGLREGLSMKVPLDVSQTIIGDIGAAVDAITPRLVGREVKVGTAVTNKIDWVNQKLDHITWDYLHAGIKGALFLKEFETLTLRNAEAHAKNPEKIPLKARQQIAREVATYTNDLTGGLDWFGIASEAKTQVGRALGMWLAGPEGRRIAQIMAFAPDWALSTLRAGFRAFGESDHTFNGLWKPENATDLYRRYALRSTLYWVTLLNGLNYMTSGHSVFSPEQKDPTRLQFRDGTSMQVGKHTFEAVHAATDPVRFAYNKLGYSPKMLVDLMSGKSGYGETAPKYDSFVGHAAQAALPFTANSATQPGLSPTERVVRPIASGLGFPTYGTTQEQKTQIKIERSAERERRKQTRREWGGKEK